MSFPYVFVCLFVCILNVNISPASSFIKDRISTKCSFCNQYLDTGESPYQYLWQLSQDIGPYTSEKQAKLDMLLDENVLSEAEQVLIEYCKSSCSEFRRSLRLNVLMERIDAITAEFPGVSKDSSVLRFIKTFDETSRWFDRLDEEEGDLDSDSDSESDEDDLIMNSSSDESNSSGSDEIVSPKSEGNQRSESSPSSTTNLPETTSPSSEKPSSVQPAEESKPTQETTETLSTTIEPASPGTPTSNDATSDKPPNQSEGAEGAQRSVHLPVFTFQAEELESSSETPTSPSNSDSTVPSSSPAPATDSTTGSTDNSTTTSGNTQSTVGDTTPGTQRNSESTSPTDSAGSTEPSTVSETPTVNTTGVSSESPTSEQTSTDAEKNSRRNLRSYDSQMPVHIPVIKNIVNRKEDGPNTSQYLDDLESLYAMYDNK